MKKISFLFLVLALSNFAYSQFRNTGTTTVTYEELYDSPYEINKLFVGFVPLYTDMFVSNINAGYGLDISYYLTDIMDFKVSGRLPYYNATDFTRDLAIRTRDSSPRRVTDNVPSQFVYFDGAITYHIMDFEEDSESKIAIQSKNANAAKSASRVPTPIRVPNKKRVIVGARAGGFFYNTSTDLHRALDNQNVSLSNDSVGFVLPDSIFAVGNIQAAGFFIGGSWTRIKNYAAKPTKTYGDIVDDMIFTAYADIMIAPWITMQDVRYTRDIPIAQRTPGGPITETILLSTQNVSKNLVGFRFGIDGKFNRTLSWGWNAEMGYRPGLQTRGFYMLLKLAFPLYSTPLDYEIEAFGK